MSDTDWPVVREIYLEGIRTGNATFETQVPDWDRWDTAHLKSSRFVAVSQNVASHETAASHVAREVLGWAALTAVSSRCVYAGVAEVSVYIAERARGRKIGSALLAALVEASEREGIWTLQAGIFPENAASVALHKRFGFRIVGTRERIGQMGGRWRDTLLLERRSKIVGV
jgi:L-amino acid N-acyltransferase YncA